MPGHRFHRSLNVAVRIDTPQFDRAFDGESGGNIAVQRIMRAGLIGDCVDLHSATNYFREQFGAVAGQSHRNSSFLCARLRANVEGFIERPRHPITVTGAHAPLNACRIDFDAQKNCAVQSGCQRLGATHTTEST